MSEIPVSKHLYSHSLRFLDSISVGNVFIIIVIIIIIIIIIIQIASNEN